MQASRILEVGRHTAMQRCGWRSRSREWVGFGRSSSDAGRTNVARSYFPAPAKTSHRGLQHSRDRVAGKLPASQPGYRVRLRQQEATRVSRAPDSHAQALRAPDFHHASARRGFRRSVLAAPRLDARCLPSTMGSRSARAVNDEARRPFKHAMRRVPTGVTVVTSLKDGEPRGITVNAFASVSLDPPSLLICVNREARSYLFISTLEDLLRRRARRQSTPARRAFSGKGPRAAVRRDWVRRRFDRRAGLDGAIAHFDCEVAHEYTSARIDSVGRVLSCAVAVRFATGVFQRRLSRFRHPCRLKEPDSSAIGNVSRSVRWRATARSLPTSDR